MAVYTSFDALRGTDDAHGVSDSLRGDDGKFALMQAGAAVRYRRYQRASHDPGGTQSSVETQSRRNLERGRKYGWTEIDTYTDNDKPASKRARKLGRKHYERMLEEMREDPGDVLIMFELARGSRDLAVFVALRDMCAENGPYFWCVGDKMYDVRDKQDRQTLTNLASQAEGGSDNISEAVLAGLQSQALDGRPHGPVPFGYLRFYKVENGKFLKQVPDDKDQGGWSAADEVRKIFASYLAGEPVYRIVDSLNERRIPPPRLYGALQKGQAERAAKWAETKWAESPVYNILKNPSYMGVRMHHGVMTKEGCWEALIDEETYFAAAKRMERQSFSGERPAEAQTLLTCLALCHCGEKMVHQKWPGRQSAYRCRRGDSMVPADAADRFVELAILHWFAEDTVADVLRPDTSAETAVARDRAEKMRTSLAYWKKMAMDPERDDVTEEDYEVKYRELMPKIRKAEEASTATMPPLVKDMIGPDAVRKWKSKSLQGRRAILREAARIVVLPAGRGCRNKALVERIEMVRAY